MAKRSMDTGSLTAQLTEATPGMASLIATAKPDSRTSRRRASTSGTVRGASSEMNGSCLPSRLATLSSLSRASSTRPVEVAQLGERCPG